MDGDCVGELKKVIACMKQLERKLRVNDFQDKLVVQKTICLLELLGFDMSYSFSMYIRGPYSPDLTSDLYNNKDQVENLRTDYAITNREKSLIAKVAETSNNLEPAMLEIMATYAFLVIRGSLGSKDATTELKKLKPFYSEAKIAVGISRAKQLFPPAEKEVKEMKAEFEGFEDAAVSDNKY
jgi:uncharacterized protein YwgA